MALALMHIQSTKLTCSRCNFVQIIQRKKSKLKKAGHIKHLWCPKCKDRVEHIESSSY